ncbi:hypothetical protein [Ulvibacter litoralis]|uniref:Uncharacterized protein n=1 Tax=Ulvibacter litoralis TaxID=227084 RepID=A0A1G7IID1_9FLAO|nr:hypothetical protein [Ulvibacter litoralis]GHC60924.1 hypothetical protein GCM10008083_27490 [Ulvibacter litoralis]SDF12481.1 hypothetical protein SAMN05421855_10626 [Ulvibacter litoralis]
MKKLLIFFALIGFLTSCSNDDPETDPQEFVPGEVSVGIKSGTDINNLFDFINQFDLEVDNVNSLTFTSDLPSDNLQFVLDNLNEKNYTNDGVSWFVTGYLQYQTNQIWIFPRLFDINNIDYQQDWLSSMIELELHDNHNVDLNSGIIHFKVPVGEEVEWKNKFEIYDIVEWSELIYFSDIQTN